MDGPRARASVGRRARAVAELACRKGNPAVRLAWQWRVGARVTAAFSFAARSGALKFGGRPLANSVSEL
jgi:hypothetical protein